MARGYDDAPFGRLRLHENEKATTDKHPVATGTGEMSKEFVRSLVNKFKETGEDEVKIRVASWERTSKAGNDYLFVKVELWEERERADSSSPTKGSSFSRKSNKESTPEISEEDLPF